MEEKFTLLSEEIKIDNFGRIIITNNEFRQRLEVLVNNGDLVASNSCTNNGACGNDVNAGGCGNTVNGSCSSSFLNSDEILIQQDDVIFKNPLFNSQVLNEKLKETPSINLEFKAFKNA
ncbi:hypothetical protein [uncultured Tenacibaculum sp.]|uniref:hypothetical protein n=1 Tax=uncultured Tenacibaculum sp. TaxID=174713 RepID=UPI0026060517|nr:hypothetical protein [uncultured Tenacibaculum sp.]